MNRNMAKGGGGMRNFVFIHSVDMMTNSQQRTCPMLPDATRPQRRQKKSEATAAKNMLQAKVEYH